MNNKYQEALDRIGRNYYLSQESGDFEHFENLYLENKKTLQELVDKATPFKPLNQRYDNIRDIGGGYCKCNSTVYESHIFCPDCGQHLDWSKDEE